MFLLQDLLLFGHGSKHDELGMVNVKSNRAKGSYGYGRKSSATRDNEEEGKKKRKKEGKKSIKSFSTPSASFIESKSRVMLIGRF